MRVIVKDVLGKDRGMGADDADRLYSAIYRIDPDDLFLSFEGMKGLGDLFLKWSIGAYVWNHSYVINNKRLGFKGLNYYAETDFQRHSIEYCIEEVLMGRGYDKLAESTENTY